MTDYQPKRADHLYAWRKLKTYQHHGIVLTKEDILEKVSSDLIPKKMESLMIIDQNLQGLEIVTLIEFQTEHGINYVHRVGCAEYNTDPMKYYLNRSGTCYVAKRLSEDDIINNAIRIYNDEHQREIWQTYSLALRNCEQFAFICSTNVEYVLGEQVINTCNVIKTFFVNGMFHTVKFIFQALQKLAAEVVSGIPINTVLKGSGLGAVTVFAIDGMFLTIRLYIYYYYVESRPDNLAREYAITPEDYLQQMIESGFGSVAAFGMSVASFALGSALFVSTMPPMVCSIFFGFLGYVAARKLTGLVALQVRKKINTTDTTTSINTIKSILQITENIFHEKN